MLIWICRQKQKYKIMFKGYRIFNISNIFGDLNDDIFMIKELVIIFDLEGQKNKTSMSIVNQICT